MINLSAAGLNETEARVYQTLLSKKEWRPTEIAKIVGESRTNTYKILDDLTELGLAEKYDKNKKIHYKANHPSRLLELAQERRTQMLESEKVLETNAQNLLSDYIKTHEQPGVRYYQGKEEISEIFKDIAKAKKEVKFVHTTEGQDFYGFETMHQLRMLAVHASVHRRALTPDTPKATIDYKEKDPIVLLKRTWLDSEEYKSPVEWGVFDDKLYIISYGKEAIGLTIQSEQISKSFTELFKIIEKGQKRRNDYDSLPKLAKKEGKYH
jgi:sugar-specific transcriptional regulator TrmB